MTKNIVDCLDLTNWLKGRIIKDVNKYSNFVIEFECNEYYTPNITVENVPFHCGCSVGLKRDIIIRGNLSDILNKPITTAKWERWQNKSQNITVGELKLITNNTSITVVSKVYWICNLCRLIYIHYT